LKLLDILNEESPLEKKIMLKLRNLNLNNFIWSKTDENVNVLKESDIQLLKRYEENINFYI